MNRPLLRVRPATSEDAYRIAELSSQLGYPSAVDEIRGRLENLAALPDHAILICAGPDESIMGWVQVSRMLWLISGWRAEIGGLVVEESQRRRGVGRRLVAEAEAWAKRKGCEVIQVRSNVVREPARGFYENNRYELIKTQRVFRKKLVP